jgi:hypothetical protein
MPDLILEARITDMQAHLQQIVSLTQWINNRDRRLRKLERLIQDVENKANDLHETNAGIYTEVFNRDLGDELENRARGSRNDAEQLVTDIREIKRHLRSMLYRADSRTEQRLNETAKYLIESATKHLNHQVRNPTTWTSWHDYERRLQPLLEDFVDFLGGMVLRDGGYEANVCTMVDTLLREYDDMLSGNVWKSITIPATVGGVSAEMAKIVRLGFTEWSLEKEFRNCWSLPLAAHEYGMLVAGVVDASSRDGATADAAGHIDLDLADAFGTYTLGIPYAAALLLLRLSPASPDEGDYRRSVLILHLLAPLVAENAELDSSRDTLIAAWFDALAQANPSNRAWAEQLIENVTGIAAPNPAPVDDVDDDAVAREARAIIAFADAAPERLRARLLDSGDPFFAYNSSMFDPVSGLAEKIDDAVAELVKKLAGNRTPERVNQELQKIAPGHALEQWCDTLVDASKVDGVAREGTVVRHILNLAWVSRLRHGGHVDLLQRLVWRLADHAAEYIEKLDGQQRTGDVRGRSAGPAPPRPRGDRPQRNSGGRP